jgi:hypothetical protein
MKTSELTGAALDWAVCSVEGEQPGRYTQYSTDWSAAGPIIERGELDLLAPCPNSKFKRDKLWCALSKGGKHYGPTPLIAAMRCYVASKLGDEVEIPNELTEGA